MGEGKDANDTNNTNNVYDEEEELLDYEEEEEKGPDSTVAKPTTESAKKGYVGIHSSGFRDFLLKPDILRAIIDSRFEHPSEGWDSLSPEDQGTISSLVRKSLSRTQEVPDSKDGPSQGTKRKQVSNDEQNSKISKSDGVPIKGGELESELEKQSKALWKIKDELKKHVTSGELREMLAANGQDSAGSKYNLRERW